MQIFVYGDVVYAQTWEVLTLKNCIKPPWKFLLVETGVLDLEIRKTAAGFRNATNNRNPESRFHWKRSVWNPVILIQNPRRGIQNLRLSWILLHGASNRWLAAVRHVPTAIAFISRTSSPPLNFLFYLSPGQSCKNSPPIDWSIHSHVDSNSCYPFLARGPDRLHSWLSWSRCSVSYEHELRD